MKSRYSFLLFLGLFLLSGFLIYQGFHQSDFSTVLNQSEIVSPAPSTIVESSPSATPQVAGAAQQTYLVSKVIDGDTIEVLIDGQKRNVRLIGINTPETVDPRRPVQCFGKEASNETKRLLEGKQVVLTKDISETDKYDRLLRLVYLPLDNNQMLFVNDYLVRQGFANNYTYPPDIKFDAQFRQAEEEAKEAKRGLWGACH